MKKSELREHITSCINITSRGNIGPVLATLDDVLEESRILVLIDDKKEEELEFPVYDLVFGYTVLSNDEKGNFRFQAHLLVTTLIHPKLNTPVILNMIPGYMGAHNISGVYLIDKNYIGDIPCFSGSSELIPTEIKFKTEPEKMNEIYELEQLTPVMLREMRTYSR
ncbi:MAG: hypothetical protein ABIG89_00690 [Candidatus Woesearchaeota archaeon]